MTAPVMSYTTLANEYLSPNGWHVEEPQPQDFWNEHDRIYVVKGDYRFPLQYKSEYKYLQIVHLFNDLSIDIPLPFKEYYEYQKAKKTSSQSVEQPPARDNEKKA